VKWNALLSDFALIAMNTPDHLSPFQWFCRVVTVVGICVSFVLAAEAVFALPNLKL
jgi:hypothetical protein